MNGEAVNRTSVKNFTIWLGLACLPLVLALVDRLRHRLDMHPDCAMYLQCGQMLLAGKIPYVDFYDVNPPLIMYFNAIPAGLAALFQQDLMLSFWIFIWMLAAITTLWSAGILFRAADAQQWQYLGPLLIAISLIMLTVKEIGQREHLFVMFYLPFFLLRWWRFRSGNLNKAEAILAGILTGIGIALKPFFFLLALLPEIYWLLSKRQPQKLLAPEVLAAGISGVVYLAHFLLVPAEMRQNFFHYLIPLVNAGYDYMNSAFPPPLPLNKRMFLLLLVLPASWILRRRCDLIMPLLMWVVGGYLCLCVQQKGFVYHAIPMFSAVILLSGLVLGILAGFKGWYGRIAAGLVGLFLALGLIGKEVWTMPGDPYKSVNGAGGGDFADIIAKHSQANEAVFFASVPVQDPYAVLVQLNRQPASRYLWLFPIPCYEQMKAKAKNSLEVEKIQKAEDAVLAQVITDIHNSKPRLIFVWKGTFTVNAAGKSPVSLFALLQRNGFDDVLKNCYEYLDRRGDTEVYIRKPQGNSTCS